MPRILLDSCVWGGALPELETLRHDVVWSGSWPEDPGDAEILAAAHDDQRILVTLDKDFGELAILQGAPHAGIVRLAGFRAKRMANAIHLITTRYENELTSGAIVTADPMRIRIRLSSE